MASPRTRSGRRPGPGIVLLALLATACGSEPGTERGPRQEEGAVADSTAAGGAADTEAVARPVADSPAVDGPAPSEAAPTDSLAPGTYVYTCPTGYAFAVRVARDSATVELVNRDVTLPRTPAGSGATYATNDVVFQGGGSEGTLEAGGTAHRGCRVAEASSPWEKARLLGIELRALGQEPGWIVDVNPDDWIRYIGDYGQTRMVFPPVAPEGDSTVVTYRTATADHSLMIEFRRTLCHDVMSGQPFAYTVSLEVDGRELQGCGRRLSEP